MRPCPHRALSGLRCRLDSQFRPEPRCLGFPPSSLYWTQKSVSRISAAAANLSRAASPAVIPFPFSSSSPNAFEAELNKCGSRSKRDRAQSHAAKKRSPRESAWGWRKIGILKLQLTFNVIHRGSFRINCFAVRFCCGSDESWSDASHRFHTDRIATNCAKRFTGKVTLLLPMRSGGESDWVANGVADVTHRMNQWRIANFLAQPPNKNFD